jgi:hypothetical protein
MKIKSFYINTENLGILVAFKPRHQNFVEATNLVNQVRCSDRGMLTRNSYLYGGYGFEESPAYDDVYILSLPSFTWIKAFSSEEVPHKIGHGGCSANVVNRAQMLVIGGWFPLYDKCDALEGQGQHNMVLGYNGGEAKLWDKFSPQLDDYVVPSPIIAAIGGGYAFPIRISRSLQLIRTGPPEVLRRLRPPRGVIQISLPTIHSNLLSQQGRPLVLYPRLPNRHLLGAQRRQTWRLLLVAQSEDLWYSLPYCALYCSAYIDERRL